MAEHSFGWGLAAGFSVTFLALLCGTSSYWIRRNLGCDRRAFQEAKNSGYIRDASKSVSRTRRVRVTALAGVISRWIGTIGVEAGRRTWRWCPTPKR
jgi:hypothetical protein